MTRRADPRTTRLPVQTVIAQGGEIPDFTPVPRKGQRHDGWTPERQRAFIEALADTGSVQAACKSVNMSQPGAYHLRRQKGAESFRAAWQKALDLGVQQLEDIAMDRALNGVEEPVYSYGELVGVRKKVNDRLLMFMLRNRAPERFGKNGGSLKGLNAIGKMEKRRLKRKWRAKFRRQWEAERDKAKEAQRENVTVAQVRASIDVKVENIRRQVALERQREWEQMSADTRAAWQRFEELRNRDFERMKADEDWQRRHELGPREDGRRETVNVEPFDWKPQPEPPKERKTVHGLKDEGWE